MITGKHKIDLEHGQHRVEVQNTFPLLVSLNSQPIRALPAGTHSFVLRGQKGKIEVDPTEPKKPYSVVVTSRLSPIGEKLDDLPPPEPPAPDNYLQMLRQRVRQNMGVKREEFAEYHSIYETEDAIFEEEEEAIFREMRQQRLTEDAENGTKGTKEEQTSAQTSRKDDRDHKDGKVSSDSSPVGDGSNSD